MRFSKHFYDNTRSDRPEITEEMCIEVVNNPVHSEAEGDSFCYWGQVEPFTGGRPLYLKVVTSLSSDFVITAHLDSNFGRKFRRTRQ